MFFKVIHQFTTKSLKLEIEWQKKTLQLRFPIFCHFHTGGVLELDQIDFSKNSKGFTISLTKFHELVF